MRSPDLDVTVPGTLDNPSIDGTIDPGEWSHAWSVDMSIVPGFPVWMYVQHDGNYLYIAVEDTSDSTLDAYDSIGIFFDDDGGVPPLLYDNLWTATSCPADEGNFWLGNFAPDPDDLFQGWIAGPASCPLQYGGTNVAIAYSLNGGSMNWEAAIDLGLSALQVSTGETFGLFAYSYRFGTSGPSGMWPETSDLQFHATYAHVTLGLIGGLPFADGFESGDTSAWSATVP